MYHALLVHVIDSLEEIDRVGAQFVFVTNGAVHLLDLLGKVGASVGILEKEDIFFFAFGIVVELYDIGVEHLGLYDALLLDLLGLLLRHKFILNDYFFDDVLRIN